MTSHKSNHSVSREKNIVLVPLINDVKKIQPAAWLIEVATDRREMETRVQAVALRG